MDTPFSKLTLAVSLITESDEETRTADCPLIIHDSKEHIAIPIYFFKKYLEQIKNNQVGFVITNDFMEKLVEEQNAVEWKDFIYFKEGSSKLVKVFLKNIKYIFSDDDYTYTCTIHNEQWISKKSLKWFNGKCPPLYFIQIHGSYFINMKFITHYVDNGVTGVVIMIDNKDLDVSKRNKEEFEKRSKPFLITVFKPFSHLPIHFPTYRKP